MYDTLYPHGLDYVFSIGKATIGLYMLARALIAAGVTTIRLIVFGMIMPYAECLYLDVLKGPRVFRRFDVGRNVSGAVIPLFSISQGHRGKLFPMLGDMGAGYGSIMLKTQITSPRIESANLKCYANIVHHIKALGITLTIPKTNNGAAIKLKQIEHVLDKLIERKVGGFRYECVFYGMMTLQECVHEMNNYPVDECVPYGVSLAYYVTKEQYMANVMSIIEDSRDTICHGDSSGHPLPSQVLTTTKVLNALGLYSEKWARVLTSSNPIVRENIGLSDRPGREKILMDIRENVYTRRAAKNRKLVSAVYTESGGTTRAFSTLNEFAIYLFGMYGSRRDRHVRRVNPRIGSIVTKFEVTRTMAPDLQGIFPVLGRLVYNGKPT